MQQPKRTCFTQLCPRLATASQMRELDRRSITEIGIPGAVLMENAGRATVDAMEREFGPVQGKGVCIFAGPGNNGGDGLVIARCVHGRGGHPLVLLFAQPQQLPTDAALNWSILKRLDLPCMVFDESVSVASSLEQANRELSNRLVHSMVDGLFGIGLTRPVEGMYLNALRTLGSLAKQHACPVVALDIPSGLNSDTGQVLGEAVQANLTVSYGLAKPGQLHHGGSHCGRLQVVDIGIPKKIVASAGLQGQLLDQSILSALAPRASGAHKGTNGHVLIIAGSAGKSGAALLAAQGAMRSGAGLVSAAVPAKLLSIFATSLVEAMYTPLVASSNCLSNADHGLLATLCQNKQALVIGPGIGTATQTAELMLRLYQERQEPMVVDADALNILAANQDILVRPGGPRLFTPHPGEMARLLNQPISHLQADRLTATRKLCQLCEKSVHPVVAVLKGAGTVLATGDGRWAINTSGNPGMATGGMGDVLAGIMAGLLAQGHALWEAACLGVYLHGAAADLLAQTQPYGYSAWEVATALPRLFTTT